MTYSTSVQGGRLRELYMFQTESVAERYTSGPVDVVALTEAWTALNIDRSEPEQGAELARANLTLTVPRDNEFALQLLDPFGVDHRTSVTMWEEDDDDAWAVAWKGRVIGASLSGHKITIECESVLTSARRMGLPARVTRTCNHAVYSRGCGLVRAAWEVNTTVTAINGYVLTVDAADGQADGWYLGGMIEYDGALRWIIAHSGKQLTLLRPFRGLAEAVAIDPVAVKIYPGCDRLAETCDIKFDNLLRRLGFDWLPERNPFDGSSVL